LADYPALDLTIRQDGDVLGLLDLVYACLDDFGPLAIHEHEDGSGLRVFFRSPDVRDGARRSLVAEFERRLEAIAPVDVPDEGWARRSQAQLTPIRVGRILVTPPWIADLHEPETIRIVIEPSMGFGTGHHATTRLCLALLQNEALANLRVIDVGTGSGVLAIAAWKLGATDVDAIDCDPDALQNARENIAANGDPAAIRTIEADLSTVRVAPAGIVVANLTAGVLERYASTLIALAKPDGRLVLSGFAPDDLTAIERAVGRTAVESRNEGAWTAATFAVSPPRSA
jgi:ribosomal protein L11 methyltransferase